MSGQELVQQLINALALGATYALLALGLAMVFSILGLVNFAHGEIVTVGAYALLLTNQLGLPFPVQVISAVTAGAGAALLMQQLVFRPLRSASFITLLISSFALSILIQNCLRAFVSPRQQAVPLPDFVNSSLHIGPFSIGWLEIVTLISCLVALVALTLFLHRSTTGIGMMAAAQDPQAARLMGLSPARVTAVAFAISGALAGLAAIFLLARRGTVDPAMGFTPLLSGFIAVVIGGLGSLPGAALGGFLLAMIQVTLDATLPPDILPFHEAIALGIVIVILYFRPEGLLSRTAEAK